MSLALCADDKVADGKFCELAGPPVLACLEAAGPAFFVAGMPNSQQRIPPTALLRALLDLRSPLPIEVVEPSQRGARYSDSGGAVAPLADLYLPRGEARASVLLFHGGGFAIGSRTMKAMRYLSSRLVENGFASIAFDYPLIFRGGHAEHMIASSDAVLRWWLRRAPSLGVNSKKVYAVGLSAGASLMLMFARRHPRAFERMAAFFGVYDFATLRDPLARLMCRQLFGSPARDVWRRYSPLYSDIPNELLLLHGTGDRLVPVRQTYDLAEIRRQRGLATEVEIYPGAPHGFLNNPRWGVAETSIARVLKFFGERPDAYTTARY